MRKVSSTTYIKADLVDNDMLATVAAATATAAERLGGEDGLSCISANQADENHVGMTWRREWEEEDPPPPEAAPDVAKKSTAEHPPIPVRRFSEEDLRKLGIKLPEPGPADPAQ